jgi:hypothetical protein
MELDDGKWKQTLMSDRPLGTGKHQVCGDDLIGIFARERITSNGMMNFMCHHFFWHSLATERKNQIELACAAYRAEPKCAEFVKSL